MKKQNVIERYFEIENPNVIERYFLIENTYIAKVFDRINKNIIVNDETDFIDNTDIPLYWLKYWLQHVAETVMMIWYLSYTCFHNSCLYDNDCDWI